VARITFTKAAWQKHTYVNNTPHTLELLSGEDQHTHLALIAPHSTLAPAPSAPTNGARTIVYDYAITTNNIDRFVFAPC
jgi:hypothetical protein